MKCQECGKEGTGDVCASCGGTIEESPRWYAEGIAHLTEQKQYAIAFDLLEEGIERYPQSAMLWYNGGVLEELLNNKDGAIRRYQKVLELRPNNEKAKKALEKLLGRPLFTPPPTTSYAAAQASQPAPPPAAPAAPATVTLPEPPPAAAPAKETAPPVAMAAPPVAPPPATGIHADAPATDALPLELPSMPEITPLGGLPWPLISMISGFASIGLFIFVLVAMNLKFGQLPGEPIKPAQAITFVTSLVLFTVTLVLHFVARANVLQPTKRRR